MEPPVASAEHVWLRQFVGNWEVEGCGADGERTLARETYTAMGEVWVLGVGESEGHEYRFTFGFEPEKGRFTGTFISNYMAQLWVYDGFLDGDTLVLESEGPNFDGSPGKSLYRDLYTFEGPDGKRLRSVVQNAEGGWEEFMNSPGRRVG